MHFNVLNLLLLSLYKSHGLLLQALEGIEVHEDVEDGSAGNAEAEHKWDDHSSDEEDIIKKIEVPLLVNLSQVFSQWACLLVVASLEHVSEHEEHRHEQEVEASEKGLLVWELHWKPDVVGNWDHHEEDDLNWEQH